MDTDPVQFNRERQHTMGGCEHGVGLDDDCPACTVPPTQEWSDEQLERLRRAAPTES